MRQKSSFTAIVLLVVMVVSQEFGPLLSAQTAVPTPRQLDQLLAPVALYPDSLLAQITTASTNPQEILDVDNWLQQNAGLTGDALVDAAQKQGFDPAFIALVNFPQVLDMMAQNIDDYSAIGQAFLADQGSVTASIQRLRAQAYAAGTLSSNSQQQVEVQQPAAGQTIYVIQPANPQVVYVPVYNPTVVYVKPATSTVVVTSLVTFGAGIAIGALMVSNQPWGWGGWGWGWSSGRCYYNHTAWVAWGNPYRPLNVWYRPRPVLYTSRPGYGGNWHYRPPNYRPPVPAPRPPNRQPWGPNNRPGYKPPTSGGRPPAQQPKPGRPTQPIAKPYTPKPSNSTKPPSSGKPNHSGTNKPPANGANRPATPPTTQPKPAPATRPQQPQTKPTSPSQRPATTPPATQPKPAPATRPQQPQTKPTSPSQRPATTPPATQPKPAPANRSQPQKKPAPQSKPAPKPQSKPQSEPKG